MCSASTAATTTSIGRTAHYGCSRLTAATQPRGGEAENQLEEVALIWNRIGDDRIQEIDARRRLYETRDRLGISSYTLGDGSYPEMEEHWHAECEAEIALRVDFKSMFVFGETLIASYIVMSEPVWEAPGAVNHGDGPTKFIGSVRQAQEAGTWRRLYMDVLLEKLSAVDEMLGFYDKSVIHLPPDMLLAGSGGSLAVPLDFHVDHAQRRGTLHSWLSRSVRSSRQSCSGSAGRRSRRSISRGLLIGAIGGQRVRTHLRTTDRSNRSSSFCKEMQTSREQSREDEVDDGASRAPRRPAVFAA